MTMDEAMIAYYEHYKPKAVKDEEQRKRREKFIFLGIILFIIIAVTYLYNK
jgi:nitrate reductase NapE component